MIWSYYNLYKKTPKGNTLIYNTCSGGLFLLKKGQSVLLENLQDLLKDDKFSRVIEDLKKQYYIVDFDEQKLLEHQFNTSAYNTNVLGLTICPTMQCNLSCTYCYENRQQKEMNEETINNLLKFIRNQVKDSKHLSVTWYGGEPLYNIDVLTKINSGIQELVSEKNLSYDAFMITNSTLIDDTRISILKDLKITKVQVTLDGSSFFHNQRRITPEKEGTYSIIIQKMKKLLENNIGIVLRINIDKLNSQSLSELLNDLVKNEIKAEIHLGHIQANTESFTNESICMSKSEYDKFNYDFILENAEKYKDYFTFGDILATKKNVFCGAHKHNSFVVDSEGYAYKCWNEVGNPTRAVFNVNSIEDIVINNMLHYEQVNPFKIKCKDCKILPICLGGCPYNRLSAGKDFCTGYMKVVDNYLSRQVEVNDL